MAQEKEFPLWEAWQCDDLAKYRIQVQISFSSALGGYCSIISTYLALQLGSLLQIDVQFLN